MPGLIIKESDNKAKVKIETKIAKGIARAFKRISGRD